MAGPLLVETSGSAHARLSGVAGQLIHHFGIVSLDSNSTREFFINRFSHHGKIIVSLAASLLAAGCAGPAIRANAASGIAITYDAHDTQSCMVLAQVQSDPRPLGGTLPGMVNDMVVAATALHADTLLVLPHGFVVEVLKGVAYRCAKTPSAA